MRCMGGSHLPDKKHRGRIGGNILSQSYSEVGTSLWGEDLALSEAHIRFPHEALWPMLEVLTEPNLISFP